MADEVLHARVDHVHEEVVKLGRKLDVITDIMLAMARTEERVASVIEHNLRQDAVIEANKIEARQFAEDLKRDVKELREVIDGPEGLRERLTTVVTRVGAVVAVGVFVINIYFKTYGTWLWNLLPSH